MEYPYAYFSGRSFGQALGQGGYPFAALADATGTVVWTGHPASLTSAIIEEHLDGTLQTPLFEWPAGFLGVAKDVAKGDFADALSDLDKLVEKGVEGAPDFRSQVEAMLNGRLAGLEARLERGDFLGVVEGIDALEKGVRGLPQAERLDALATAVDEHPDAKHVIVGQKKLAKLMQSELRKRKQLEKAIEEAEKLEAKYEGTIVAREASAFRMRVQKQLQQS